MAAQEWLLANTRFLGIAAAVLAVTHPAQFHAGISMMHKVKDNPDLLCQPGHFIHVLLTWCIPFSGVSIMANRETIYHRDIGGSPYWYDVLATMGRYTDTKFHLPSLNVALSYTPGTMIAIAGRVLPHSVDAVEVGDRVCFAWFSRDDVRTYLGIPEGTLSTTDGILSS